MLNIKFEKIFTASNLISFLRLLLIMPTMYFVTKMGEHDNYRIYILLMFLLAYLSDLLDGYLARKFDEISELGKIIDPLADKLFVIILFVQLYMIAEISSFYFWIIVSRDIIIFLGGIYVSNKIGKVLPSNLLGKITVASIGLFLIVLIAGLEKASWIFITIQYLSIFLSFASVFGYAIRGYESINWYKKNGITQEHKLR